LPVTAETSAGIASFFRTQQTPKHLEMLKCAFTDRRGTLRTGLRDLPCVLSTDIAAALTKAGPDTIATAHKITSSRNRKSFMIYETPRPDREGLIGCRVDAAGGSSHPNSPP
jgi:hypothetical protein